MDTYPRRFVQMSLLFLSVGTVLGVAMGVWQRGAPALRYVHIHCMLFGFLSMMVFGVAYHVLPRFTGTPFRHPCAVALHFYLANIGLLGLLGSYSVKIWYPSPWWTGTFIGFALVAALSMFLFVFNAAPIVFARQDSAAAMPACAHAQPPEVPAARATDGAAEASEWLNVPVAELMQRRPGAGALLARFGIDMCCGGRHTLEQVCRKKGIDREALLRALEAGT